MSEKFKINMIEKTSKINLNVSEEDVIKFEKYMDMLLKWNQKINLTTIVNEEEIILKHFIDSMTILKYIDNKENIIDVGTGAGFPGMPVAILKKDCNITLLDSLNKRIIFLNEVIGELELENVHTEHLRAEDGGRDRKYREMYDIATSRAVANLSTLVEYLLPFVKIGGKCICMKGIECKEEIQCARYAINELGGRISKIENIILPDSDINRTLIIIDKIKDTPNKYPRKAGVPSKVPLKKDCN